MKDYRADRSWSDRYIPQIKQIVGPHLLEPSSLELDAHQATDLIVLHARDMRIGARVRRPGYAARYPHEFTIRSHRESGSETEFSKIIDGWGDWLFYGHANENHWIERWWLIDLSVFRATLIRHGTRVLGKETSNGDGTFFVPCDVRKFPAELILASEQPPIEEAAA